MTVFILFLNPPEDERRCVRGVYLTLAQAEVGRAEDMAENTDDEGYCAYGEDDYEIFDSTVTGPALLVGADNHDFDPQCECLTCRANRY